MTKRKKRTSKNEFRYNRKTQHTDYVFEDDGKKYSSFGITHKDKTFNQNNMPLQQNPQKGKNDPAYIRNGVNHYKYSYYDKPRSTFQFSSFDFKNVKAKVRNYKKKRKKNK